MKRSYRVGRKSTTDILNCANTRHLTRVIVYLSEVKKATMTDIIEATGMNGTKTKDAVHWLSCNSIINKFREGLGTYYSISQVFKESRWNSLKKKKQKR